MMRKCIRNLSSFFNKIVTKSQKFRKISEFKIRLKYFETYLKNNLAQYCNDFYHDWNYYDDY